MGRAVYFMHIAKTGGVSLHEAIAHHFGPYDTAPVYMTHQLAALVADHPEALDRYRFVRGHLGSAPFRHLAEPPVTLTMLRDPLDRTLSHFEHVARNAGHWAYKRGLPSSPSLEDFLRFDLTRNMVTDHQVRNVGQDFDLTSPIRVGGERLHPNLGWLLANCPAGDGVLDRAKDRLAGFAWVGLTERFAESLAALDRVMGWERSEELVLNTSSRDRDIPAGARREIGSLTALDRDLYDVACERFQTSAS